MRVSKIWAWSPGCRFAHPDYAFSEIFDQDTTLRSRCEIRPSFASFTPSKESEGAGDAGCTLHPRSRVLLALKENAHERTGEAEAVRHPLRNGFTAYTALSLGTGLSCPHHRRGLRNINADLTPASGRQDHTALPHAKRAVRRSARQRPPHPASYVCDDRDTPLMWRRDGANHTPFLVSEKAKYFSPAHLTGFRAARDLPDAGLRPERAGRFPS